MNKLVTAAITIAVALTTFPALAQQTPANSGSPTPLRHLVYRFGYNVKAASQGTNTGTTTIDILGSAADGGMTMTATDDWWNTARPRQSYTCELYPNGGVTCAQPPYALSPIQLAVVPLLGKHYFAALSAGSHSTWTQAYNVRATFFPGASSGFAGQVYTWNCALTLNGKGTIPEQPPLIQIQSNGTFNQQGGRYTKFSQKAGILFDPRIKMPVYVSQLLQLVPQQSVNSYSVELKLTSYK